MKRALLALALLLCASHAEANPARGGTEIVIEDDGALEGDDGAEAIEETVPDAPRPTAVNRTAPFKGLPGRWVGEGRIGVKDSKPESVKCRATYFVNDKGDELRQNIRCASAGGKVEVKSNVIANGGKLTGTWNELVYNLGGEMTGEVTERGFRIVVRGGDMRANMDVIVMGDRQIVEIQFFNSSIRGLTLILKKG